MPSVLTDQNFNEDIARGLRRRLPNLAIESVRDFGYAAAPDDEVLDFAAARSCVLLTHDAKTMPPLFYRSLASGRHVPFTVVVPWGLPTGMAIDELELLFAVAAAADWERAELIRLPL